MTTEWNPRTPLYHKTGVSADTVKKIISSGELHGAAPKNFYASDIPAVQAYNGPLPDGKSGFEFTTDVPPDNGGHPHIKHWTGPRQGVKVIDGDRAIISCTVTKTR